MSDLLLLAWLFGQNIEKNTKKKWPCDTDKNKIWYKSGYT